MNDDNTRLEQDRQRILDAKEQGTGAKLLTYTKLSGPGWLQGAITLGGGSLAGSLYLGIIGGYEMMWLQPLMMIFGIVMLSAIGYVALSTQRSPFEEINRHVSPVLGWGWAIATLMANLVWAMPQFSLGTSAMQQNLQIIPDTDAGNWIGVGILFVICYSVVWSYESGGKGIKIFELVLKAMVGVIVISFFAVVIGMTMGSDGLPWGEIFAGFLPNASLLSEPASTMAPLIEKSSDPEYWTGVVVAQQRQVMVTAAATAVGINMTFLLPYSMLKRGWDRDFRGLATFDLSIGLFIPFLLATSCVVIAAAAQFHAKADEGLKDHTKATAQTRKLEAGYNKNLDGLLKNIAANKDEAAVDQLNSEMAKQKKHDTRIADKKKELLKTNDAEAVHKMLLKDPYLGLGPGPVEELRGNLKDEDKTIAATLIKRDSGALANSLEDLAGKGIAQYVFGIGVVGMAVSTIIILMLINGFTFCVMLGKPSKGALHRFGCLLPGLTGALGFIYLWTDKDAKFYLAVPTSNFGMVLLPIAYTAFLMLMNNRKVLGAEMPTGGKRLAINGLMLIGLGLALTGAGLSVINNTQTLPGTGIRVRDIALGVVATLVVLGVVVHFLRNGNATERES